MRSEGREGDPAGLAGPLGRGCACDALDADLHDRAVDQDRRRCSLVMSTVVGPGVPMSFECDVLTQCFGGRNQTP